MSEQQTAQLAKPATKRPEAKQQTAPAGKPAAAARHVPATSRKSKKPITGYKALVGRILAIVRIRGDVNLNARDRSTLDLLRLDQKMTCVVLKADTTNLGMIHRIKHIITYGEITEETIKLLKEKREKKNSEGKPLPYYRLSPPRKGFERKGTKRFFTEGGALGYRGDRINDLITRMV